MFGKHKGQPDPPEVSEKTLAVIRHCTHSVIHAASSNLLPDYHCRESGPLCRLYHEFSCPKVNSFPDIQDT